MCFGDALAEPGLGKGGGGGRGEVRRRSVAVTNEGYFPPPPPPPHPQNSQAVWWVRGWYRQGACMCVYVCVTGGWGGDDEPFYPEGTEL